MKFVLQFTEPNLSKFRAFIKMCAKIFTKSGIIMTIKKNTKITVAPDPFSISDKFERDIFETKIMELYKYYIFIEYPLISSESSIKNCSYTSLELKVRPSKNSNENENDILNKDIVTFRIAHEELNKLNDLLQTNFLGSLELSIKATPKPDFMNKPSQINAKAFLSISDKQANSIKSGILFKPLKYYVDILDYEEGDNKMKNKENEENNLGEFLYSGQIKSKFLRKFCAITNKNFNKNLIFYIFKDRDLIRKADKIFLIISYLNNSFLSGNIINNYQNYYSNEDNSQMQEFNKIYKITISSDALLKLLKNFNNDPNNPDYIAIYTKGLVMKTEFFMPNNSEISDNNNKENFFDIDSDGEGNFQEPEEMNDNNLNYMLIKSLIYYEYKPDIIYYDRDKEENQLSIKQYVMKLIENSIDDQHEELNKSNDIILEGKENIEESNSSSDDSENGNDFENEKYDEEEKKEKEEPKSKSKKIKPKQSKRNKSKNNKKQNK